MFRKKIIIHPGIGKTATSAIQHNLFENRNHSANEGLIIYPDYGIDKEFAHHYFADSYPNFEREMYLLLINRLIDDSREIVKSGNVTYILSSEFLIHSSNKHIDELILMLESEFDSVEVLFAIRNYTDLIYSSFLQAVKVKYGVVNGESIVQYAKRMGNGFDFPILIGKWSKVSVIKFVDYDKYKKNIVHAFLAAVGFVLKPECIENKMENASIIEDLVYIIYEYDKVHADGKGREQFIENMKAFSHNYKSYRGQTMYKQLHEMLEGKYVEDLNSLKLKYVEC